MKKKLITGIIAVAMLAAGSMTAHAATNTTLANVTVYDQTTPAVFAAGKDWPITTWYFYSQSGEVLGSIPNSTVMRIAREDGTDNVDWEVWLAEAFNDYRDGSENKAAVSEATPEPPKPAPAEPPKAAPEKPEEEKSEITIPTAPADPKPSFDAYAYAQDAFDLINEAREKHGLHHIEMDDYTMDLAEMRVQELEESYSHIRPDGSRMSRIYYTGEIINRRANTPQIAVESWLDSPGHRDMILAERYHSAGIACWQGSDGITYWCMLFCR